MLLLKFKPAIFYMLQVRDFIMSPIKNPHVEVVIVMLIVPVVVNVSEFSL